MPNVIHNTRIMETASRISFEIRYTLQNLMNKTNDHRLDSYENGIGLCGLKGKKKSIESWPKNLIVWWIVTPLLNSEGDKECLWVWFLTLLKSIESLFVLLSLFVIIILWIFMWFVSRTNNKILAMMNSTLCLWVWVEILADYKNAPEIDRCLKGWYVVHRGLQSTWYTKSKLMCFC